MKMTNESVFALLDRWVECGWLRELDRSLALFLQQESADVDPLLLLGAALVSYQLGRGHVCLDLSAALNDSAFTLALPPEGDRGNDHIPPPAQALVGVSLENWLAALRRHPLLVAEAAGNTPLVLRGDRLYLRRYWQYEQDVRTAIEQRLAQGARWRAELPRATLRRLLSLLFKGNNGGRTDWQKLACALAAGSGFSIITGGPGTGKTTTVVKLLALLQALALETRGQPLRIRLAAPTGKAAARLNESIAGAMAHLPLAELGLERQDIDSKVVTLHRLLGSRPDTRHFRHHAGHPLMLDVLVVDEASMVDLEMMAALLAAMPEHARLILLGDKDQLASVEAGALLGELCRRAAAGHYLPRTRDWLLEVADAAPDEAMIDPQGSELDQAIAMLRYSHRFGADSGIGQLAAAVNQGDGQALARLWQQDYPDLARLTLDPGDGGAWRRWVIDGAADAFAPRAGIAPPVGYGHYLRVMAAERPDPRAPQAAFDAWAAAVLEAFGQFQLLCALRRGIWGVEGLNARIAELLFDAGLLDAWHNWYPGRPVLVTRNDYGQKLMNGDIGIALEVPQRLPDGGQKLGIRVAFPAGDGSGAIRWILPGRLPSVETVFAMTVHKSQGSEFAHTALLLPDNLSPILTRELIYTGITRARHWFSLGGGERHDRVLTDAVSRRVLRSGGLLLD
ncbi:exodeoxyribonuclease V subunit alpha [Brenneria tiliae]|uniref:RecBCD enzyme subunit RecD n=1 Tax=Brenneria tiliae TaxID=2914984 RepID=A0ABT0MT22_9GAMM|nr:exodeoxyribonuclease V subunit alpha [Brenneria tiliae]MCL2892985.1 exodeoxyribonuclease V subunit alpha [Brenneria tiliae]